MGSEKGSECYWSMSQGEGAGGLWQEELHSPCAENQAPGNIPQHLPPVLTLEFTFFLFRGGIPKCHAF